MGVSGGCARRCRTAASRGSPTMTRSSSCFATKCATSACTRIRRPTACCWRGVSIAGLARPLSAANGEGRPNRPATWSLLPPLQPCVAAGAPNCSLAASSEASTS
jgi:hypothetical protein